MNPSEFINELQEWNDLLHQKQIYLDRGYRVYKSLYFIQMASVSIFGALAGFFSGYSVVTNTTDNNQTMSIVFSILSLTCSIVGLFWTAVGIVFSPQTTASQCGVCSKAYFNLYNEIEVKIIEMRKQDVSDPTFTMQLLYYSSRIYNITITEPGLILIGRLGNKISVPRSGLSHDQLNHILDMVEQLPPNEDNEEVKRIIKHRLEIVV